MILLAHTVTFAVTVSTLLEAVEAAFLASNTSFVIAFTLSSPAHQMWRAWWFETVPPYNEYIPHKSLSDFCT